MSDAGAVAEEAHDFDSSARVQAPVPDDRVPPNHDPLAEAFVFAANVRASVANANAFASGKHAHLQKQTVSAVDRRAAIHDACMYLCRKDLRREKAGIYGASVITIAT